MPSPDSGPLPLGTLVLWPISLLALLLPGWALSVSLPRGPIRWTASLAASFVLFFHLVLLADWWAWPIGRLLILAPGALAIVWLLGRRLAAGGAPAEAPPSKRALFGALLALVVGLGVAAPSLASPLSTWDNHFRWSHLALLIKSQGSLAHYPPVDDADYAIYPWSDGIPPGVSIVNSIIYIVTGGTQPVLLAVRVAPELVLLAALALHLASRLWGEQKGNGAIAALGTSALFVATLAMSQEIGLASVFVLLLAALLTEYARAPGSTTALWARIASGADALVRGYNLIYLPAMAALLLALKAPRAHILIALGTGIALTTPWCIRNAWMTGTPLYPHTLGGLFPGNPMHDAYIQAVRIQIAPRGLGGLACYGAALLVGGGLCLLPAIHVFRKHARLTLPLWGLATVSVMLWLLTSPMTAGGWLYAAMVSAVALPLAAVATAWWWSHGSRWVRFAAGAPAGQACLGRRL